MGKQFSLNRKAFHDYEIIEQFEAGISLIGSEVKAIRAGKVNLKDSFVKIILSEAFVFGMHISYLDSTNPFYKPNEKRDRKLLLHKKEILKLAQRVALDGMTIVPISIYANDKNKIKMQIALAKGKQLHDKRASEKEKDAKKEADQAMKREVR